MGSAFYAEWQIWPWAADPNLVMFGMLTPDIVMHWPHVECREECPHAVSACGRFTHQPEERTEDR